MSEIKRYMYARDGMVPDAEHLRGSGEPEFWVRFTDHEAAIARLERDRSRASDESQHYSDRLDEAGDHIKAHLTRIAELEVAIEQVLADAKARIEAPPKEGYPADGVSAITAFNLGRKSALAALTQPQTERCPEDCDGFGRLIGDSDGPCPACSGLESDGGGAATAAGVADADLVRVGDFFGLPAFTHPDVKPGIVGIVSAGEVTATITGTAPQRPGDAIKKEES